LQINPAFFYPLVVLQALSREKDGFAIRCKKGESDAARAKDAKVATGETNEAKRRLLGTPENKTIHVQWNMIEIEWSMEPSILLVFEPNRCCQTDFSDTWMTSAHCEMFFAVFSCMGKSVLQTE